MKVIELLNKRANGEEVPKKIRIENWGYIFEWVEYLDNYYDKRADLDLMSALSMSKEELNYEVKIIEEEIEIIEEGKPIEKIRQFCEYPCSDGYECWSIQEDILVNKINELVDKVNKLERE